MEKTNFTFGKYKGRPIDDILRHDPGYVAWCIDNIEWFKLTEAQYQILESLEEQVPYFVLDDGAGNSWSPDDEPAYTRTGRYRSESWYDFKGTQLTSTEKDALINSSHYDAETDEHYGYTEHMGTIYEVTYHKDGGTTTHFGGPCGPLYTDRDGNM